MKPLPTTISAAASSLIFLATCTFAMLKDRPVVAAICGLLGMFLLIFSATPPPRTTK